MKKWLYLVPVVALFFSCASAPKTETPAATPAQTGNERTRAVDAMNKAKSIKADVAVKNDYNQALTVFNEAEALGASNSAAPAKYLEAERLFNAAYDKAKAERDEATNQLNRAKTEIRNAENDAAAFEQERQAEEAAAQGGAQ